MIGNRDTYCINYTPNQCEICLEVNLRKATPAGIREPFAQHKNKTRKMYRTVVTFMIMHDTMIDMFLLMASHDIS